VRVHAACSRDGKDFTVNGMTLDQKTEGKVTMKLVDKSKQGK
jgi:hypothetical protein